MGIIIVYPFFMKKLILLTLTSIALLSCSKDDDDRHLIEGRWYLFSMETIRNESGNITTDRDTAEGRDEIIEFLPNGIFKIDESQSTYTLAGDSVHIIFKSGNNEDRISFKYIIDKEDLTLSTTDIWNETIYEDIHRYKRL